MANPLERPKKVNKPILLPDLPQKQNNQKNNHNNNSKPNPWLLGETQPIDTIDPNASFVEYLRWMRQPDDAYKDGTKIQILQMAQDQSRKYNDRLSRLNQRTERIADKSFPAKSLWRIRVGGHRGPENILLPAFDALGIPYLPSSSLRGVARNYAIREKMRNQSLSWEEAERQIAHYFGSIETENKSDRAGKVVFLDAYPEEGCLEMDMANNIWKWEGDKLEYSPNPNLFLSLKSATFVIGLKLASNCQDEDILDKVKNWLIKGLQDGIGSQINSGYGQLIPIGDDNEISENSEQSNSVNDDKFLIMEFTIRGQLVHGSQQIFDLDQPLKTNRDGSFKFNKGKYVYDTDPKEEVRAIALKSIIRYWFRAFALGVLSIEEVQEWEGKLFGLIQPSEHKNTGWVKFNLTNDRIIEVKDKNECDRQKGTLVLSYSPFIPEDENIRAKDKTKKAIVADLFKNLIWLTFRLGGIGQGTRRTYHKRKSNPYHRGSRIFPKNPNDEKFWNLIKDGETLCLRFQQKIKNLYKALEQLTGKEKLINNTSHSFSQVTEHKWSEVVDSNCRIILLPKQKSTGQKTPALKLLHEDFHKLESEWENLNKEVKELKQREEYKKSKEKQEQADEIYAQMKSLCGGIKTEKDFFGKGKDRDAIPSPIWITDLDLFEVVTVFGATQNPRKKFLEKLLQENASSYHQIFPITNT